MKIKIISVVIIFCFITAPSYSQTYIGAGYAGGIIDREFLVRDQTGRCVNIGFKRN